MILEEGQIINDGNNDLIVCSIKKYKGINYAYVLNEKTTEVGFYRFDIQNEVYDFELIEDEKLIQELILIFAKDYVSKNPDTLSELGELGIFNNEEKNN